MTPTQCALVIGTFDTATTATERLPSEQALTAQAQLFKTIRPTI